MKRVVVGVGLLLGFSGFASADDSSNWFNRHNLPFHKTAKGHPVGRPGGSPLVNQGNSGGSGSGQSFSGGSNSNGNNSGGNSGALPLATSSGRSWARTPHRVGENRVGPVRSRRRKSIRLPARAPSVFSPRHS